MRGLTFLMEDIQKDFIKAVRILKKNARKPDKDGNIQFSREEALALAKFLAATILDK